MLAFTAVLGVLFLTLVAEAQQARKVPQIGVTLVGSAPSSYADALRRGLAELGWAEGQNKVDVIVAGGGGSAVRAAGDAAQLLMDRAIEGTALIGGHP